VQSRTASLIPIVLLVILAAISLWLERSVRSPQGDTSKLRHDPDFWVERFSVKKFGPDGTLTSTLTAQKMTHYPDDETSHLDAPSMRYYRKTSVLVTGTQGLVSKDGQQISLTGGARIVREGVDGAPATQVATPVLHVFPDEELARSDLPVTITQGQSVINGRAMEINHATGVSVLSGRVTGSIYKKK
jgi:lipopolysaccharide export system protein LptC